MLLFLFQEEILARLEAEKRLKEAEESLTRLEKAVLGVEAKGQEQHELQEEMLGDVKTLKRELFEIQELFFIWLYENCI